MLNTKKTHHTGHEPLIRIAKRDTIPLWESIAIRAAAILLALVVCGFLIYAIVGLNPIQVYISMFKGAFGSEKRIWVTLRDTMMLLCIGIGLAPAFKMRFWNVGAEGQILVGGIASAACMLYLAKGTPNAVLLPKVLRAYGPAVHGPLAELAFSTGLATPGTDPGLAAERFIKKIEDMNRAMGIPEKIEALREEDIPALAAQADKEANPLYPVPVLWDADELCRLYRLVL